MAREKLKNLIILILVLVNLFLLALVVPKQLDAKRRQQQANEALSALYAQAGVTLQWQDIPQAEPASALQLPAPDGLACLRVLLGDDLLTTADGSVTSPRGSAVILDGGEISVTLTDGEAVADKEAFAKNLLDDMDTEYHTITSEGDTVTATICAEGLPLLTKSMVLTFENDKLVGGHGLPAGKNTAFSTGSKTGTSAADALMAFLRSRLDIGWMGSTVLAVTQGYDCAWDAVRQTWVLSPAWQISTDSGNYLVDAQTGAVKNVTQM